MPLPGDISGSAKSNQKDQKIEQGAPRFHKTLA
jgi:hypothetical protein